MTTTIGFLLVADRARKASKKEACELVESFIRDKVDYRIQHSRITGEDGLLKDSYDVYSRICLSKFFPCVPNIPLHVICKFKLRPDLVEFMERKCRETEQNQKKEENILWPGSI